MSPSFSPRSHGWPWFMPASLVLLIIAALSLVFVSSDTAFAATSFNPQATVELANPAPNAASDITTGFCLDFKDNPATPKVDACEIADLPAKSVNFRAVISFTPADFTVPKGADVPDGSVVAKLSASATLGILNGPCSNPASPTFDMKDATTDTGNVLANAFGTENGLNPGDANDQFDAVGGQPLGVTKYPDYLTRIFPGITPRARLYGQTAVVGNNVSLSFLLFEPGTTLPKPGGGTFRMDPALGYPSVTVLQNAGDPTAVPTKGSTITDFCSQLDSNTQTLGAFRTNPPTDRTVNFVTFAAGQPDADSDGFENGLDTCPYNPDTENPHVTQGTDFDGIGDGCDPDPGPCFPGYTGTAADCENDGFPNRGDNCPQVANGDPAGDNQKDSDSDSIGDACDNNNGTVDGQVLVKCVVTAVNIGAGGTAPPQPNICNEDAVGIDVNGNGIFDSIEVAATPTPPPVVQAFVPETLSPGLGIFGPASAVQVGGAASIVATFADDAGKPLSAVEVTFKIDQQPGSDANLEGQAQVKKTTDAKGQSKATLNVGSKTGTIVVSAAAQGKTKTVTVNAVPAVAGPDLGMGSLAPAAASIPAWAAIASGLGGAGLLASLGAFASRVLRRKR